MASLIVQVGQNFQVVAFGIVGTCGYVHVVNSYQFGLFFFAYHLYRNRSTQVDVLYAISPDKLQLVIVVAVEFYTVSEGHQGCFASFDVHCFVRCIITLLLTIGMFESVGQFAVKLTTIVLDGGRHRESCLADDGIRLYRDALQVERGQTSRGVGHFPVLDQHLIIAVFTNQIVQQVVLVLIVYAHDVAGKTCFVSAVAEAVGQGERSCIINGLARRDGLR